VSRTLVTGLVRTIEGDQTACKPGSVHPDRVCPGWMAIPLGRLLPAASRDLPGRQRGNPSAGLLAEPTGRPFLVLLPVGFTVPSPLPATRCALAAPFHPCPPRSDGRSAFCGTFPGVAPAGRYPAPCSRGARTFLQRPGAGDHPAV